MWLSELSGEEFSALCGTDNECAPGCFDNIFRDYAQVVNAQDAFNLDKKPVPSPGRSHEADAEYAL